MAHQKTGPCPSLFHFFIMSLVGLAFYALLLFMFGAMPASAAEIRSCAGSPVPGQGCVEEGFLAGGPWTQDYAAGICAGYEMARQIVQRKIIDHQETMNNSATNMIDARAQLLHDIATSYGVFSLPTFNGGSVMLQTAGPVFECPSGKIIQGEVK